MSQTGSEHGDIPSLKKLPVDIQSFELMRGEHYLYVDKTRYIYEMVTQARYYFLSRPRRFGKSLLIGINFSAEQRNIEEWKVTHETHHPDH